MLLEYQPTTLILFSFFPFPESTYHHTAPLHCFLWRPTAPIYLHYSNSHKEKKFPLISSISLPVIWLHARILHCTMHLTDQRPTKNPNIVIRRIFSSIHLLKQVTYLNPLPFLSVTPTHTQTFLYNKK